MIFKQELADLILSGDKTVTRRPVKFRHDGWDQPRYDCPIPCRYEVGKTYAIQPGRGERAIGRIRILDVRAERLSDIDNVDAANEGFASLDRFAESRTSMRDDFLTYWSELYGDDYDEDALVWRIEFELVEATVLA